ncbi:glycoside hydrolase family 28 protein [Pedobacter sp. UC225_61]|uniref:glycoside hydrolase family 28 protein n=1 Tax=Pedobacter sp. UC225_61 TaxID=3374623 RepID=UPI0037ACC67A
MDQIENESAFSRRKWLKSVSIPAAAVIGASFIGNSAQAKEGNATDEKMFGAQIYNIKDFGAKGDGKTLNTTAVQAAIDLCYQEKGGTVLVPAGDFVIGTIELKSNVTLHLSNQGKLLGSPRKEDYTAGKGVPAGNGNIVMIYAANAENVSIQGRGTIDGNGSAFFTGQGDNTGPNSQGGGYFDRPHLLIFYKCYNLLLRDSFYTKSAYHCFRILNCEQVNIDGVKIYNRVNKNNDGFHFNNCKYVHIINCDVRCQDDACALFGSNQFVTVTNSSFSTRWSIFRFGSGDAQNIAISNCLIYDTYGCPIKISSGNARLENLTFSNIIMRNVTGPIGIGFSGPSKRGTNDASQATTQPTFVRNIVFNGIRATVVPVPVNHPDIPFDVKVYLGEHFSCITLNALGNNFIENVSFTDIHVSYAGGGSKELASKKDIPQTAQEYFTVWDPAPSGPPAYGMYARNVKGLTLQNVRLEFDQADARPALIFDNVHDCTITGLAVKGSKTADCTLRFTNSKDVMISSARLLTPANAFLKIDGKTNAGLMLDGGDLRKATKTVVFENGATIKSIKIRV